MLTSGRLYVQRPAAAGDTLNPGIVPVTHTYSVIDLEDFSLCPAAALSIFSFLAETHLIMSLFPQKKRVFGSGSQLVMKQP